MSECVSVLSVTIGCVLVSVCIHECACVHVLVCACVVGERDRVNINRQAYYVQQCVMGEYCSVHACVFYSAMLVCACVVGERDRVSMNRQAYIQQIPYSNSNIN